MGGPNTFARQVNATEEADFYARVRDQRESGAGNPKPAIGDGLVSRERLEPVSSWRDEEKVVEYVGRVSRLEARRAGEVQLADVLPDGLERLLDLGCGDGALISVAMAARRTLRYAVGFDSSQPMLRLAQQRFEADERVEIEARDLNEPLPTMRSFDAVVSGFAIHHLAHERKRVLFTEIVERLRPGGVFANLEVVECATPDLQDEFYARIGRAGGDPEDVLADVESQLIWMREAGLANVDCFWRWRGFALLVGYAPSSAEAPSTAIS